MLVTGMEIRQYQYCRASARHMANVCVTLKNQIVTMVCQLDLPENESAETRSYAFLSDAMRQLRRMPEFRSGRTPLQIAENLIPNRQQSR